MYPDSSSSQPISPSEDVELVRAVRAGQPSALGILYDRYSKLVYGLALRILKNPQEAEDLTQEIFLAFWRSSSYNPDRGSLSGFLVTLTRSRALDKLRSRGTSRKFLDRWHQTISHETAYNVPFERASRAERSQQVRNALAQLSEDQRQVLEMAYYEGLSQSQIARQLELPLGTVKTRSRLGLIKLRQTLEAFLQ
jgi:RNA polymerase sigma-70 factor, ECF subfamily